MGKGLCKIKNHIRGIVQWSFLIISNSNVVGFAKGSIYTGISKQICVPGLNCYSCPGAVGACPIGSLQSVLSRSGASVSFYVSGILIIFGAFMGRFVCGFLCPFGLVQDLIYKIPFIKKINTHKLDKGLRYLKYAILILFVIALPILAVDFLGQGSPWFCKYICPSGTLMAGLPLLLMNPPMRSAIGLLFSLKLVILIAILCVSIFIYRPFCRYLCPLGAIYGCFNSFAFYRYKKSEDTCIHCSKCNNACGMALMPEKDPNSRECIRCGKCIAVCPTKAISQEFCGYRMSVPLK